MSLTGIYKRKDGRWEARLRVDNNDNGKSIIKSFYGKTAIDVQKKMYTYKRSVLYDEKTEKTFFDLCYEWLEIMQNRVKPSTYANYLTKIEKHIIPAFNEKLCRQITRREVYEFMRIKLNEGLSSRYVSDILGHSKVEITLNKYVHSSIDRKRACMVYIPLRLPQLHGHFAHHCR